MLSFAANLSMLYTELPFLERFAAAARDGFTAVEYWMPYAWQPAVLQQQLADHGLQQVLINTPAAGLTHAKMASAWDRGERGTLALPQRRDEFRAGLQQALAYAQALNCPQVHVLSGVVAEPSTHTSDAAIQAHVIEQLHWACTLAAQAGVRLLLEPINPYDMPGYWLGSQAAAHGLVQAVQSPQLQVLMDLYHCHRVEGDVLGQLQQHLPTGCVGHLQIASLPLRQEPHPDPQHYPALLHAIASLGYAGWIGCEYRPAQNSTSQGLQWLRDWRSASAAHATTAASSMQQSP